MASYYGKAFECEETASGETYHMAEMVAAHPDYPLGTVARIMNLEEGGTVQVRIIDRGPTDENVAEGIIIDLSKGAAEKFGMVKEGRIRVKVKVLQGGERIQTGGLFVKNIGAVDDVIAGLSECCTNNKNAGMIV